MKKAVYYHAGCSVCTQAEDALVAALDSSRFELERVHLGEEPGRIADAKSAGVASVPALVLDGTAFHINFGASLADLEG